MTQTVPMDHPAERRRVVFDPTINLGHVLTFAGFMAAGFSAYSTLDKRLTMVEQSAAVMKEGARDSDARIKESLVELRADIKDVQRSLNDVNRQLAIEPAKGRAAP